jgi:plasmid stabilization system protein ParE
MSDETSLTGIFARSRSAILHDVALVIRHCRVSPDAEADLAAAARLLCDDTRQRALPVERAIIDLKAALLAEVPDLAPGDSLSTVRARVITMTIEEFYRS